MLLFLCVSLLCHILRASPVDSEHDWLAWKVRFGKTYNSHVEEEERRSIWQANAEAVAQHNDRFENGLETYRRGLYLWADETAEEFKARACGSLADLVSLAGNTTELEPEFDLKKPVPASWDWSKQGVVTSVKAQGSCGACWAFATAGAMEAYYKRKSGNLVDLSVQQLVSCTRENQKCKGGGIGPAMKYSRLTGLETAMEYPYTGQSDSCKADRSKVVSKMKRYEMREFKGEEYLMKRVYDSGPIAASITGTPKFDQYTSGIFSDPDCQGKLMDHSILVVGYGSENNQDFWIVKNSYGPNWGEHGYIRIARNDDNMCGISNQIFWIKE